MENNFVFSIFVLQVFWQNCPQNMFYHLKTQIHLFGIIFSPQNFTHFSLLPFNSPIQFSFSIPIKNYHHPQQSNTITNDVDVATANPFVKRKPTTKHNHSNKPKKPIAVEKPNEPNNLLLRVIAKIIHSQLVVINQREDKNSCGMAPNVPQQTQNLFCGFGSHLATTRSTIQ